MKTTRFGANAVANSSTENRMMSTIKVGRRPYLSAARPKISAPIGRAASVRNKAQETVTTSVENVLRRP